MMPHSIEETCIVNRLHLKADAKASFVEWQAKFHAVISAYPGFVSLEITSTQEENKPVWVIVQRFYHYNDVTAWRTSKERQELLEELNPLLAEKANSLREVTSGSFDQKGGVTEVFVTQVSPEKENAYREWVAKIHKIEASFPGFKGVYVQSPSHVQGKNWITLLQFDTPDNLDRWLSSKERQLILEESKPLIAALESHRVVSPYGGWFASIVKNGEMPPVWKQTMIVLLVLFPIVMFELKYLSPLFATYNSSFSTFIGNAISVTLISWPMMPIAIRFLGWWLSPQPDQLKRATIVGTAIMAALYVLEIALFWNFL